MNTWYQMWGKTYQCQISNAGGWFIGVRFSKFHDFAMIFQSSMTFPENFIFPGFPDPVGTLINIWWRPLQKFCLCFVAFWWWGVYKCVWTIWFCLMLNHWGQVVRIYVSKLTIIGSHNGLVPGQHQAIIWTNAGILLIWTLPVGTNFSGISSEIHTFSFKKLHLNVLSGQWWPFCLGLNVLHGGYMF